MTEAVTGPGPVPAGSQLRTPRAAAVAGITLTTVNIAHRTRIASRWLTLAGLPCALVLLVGTGITPWVELLFPLWILALSLDILRASHDH